MDTKYTDKSIVGWYHTHPDFGIFLSDRDRFIQENFFSGAGQVALVIDPIRKTVGVFTWRERQAGSMAAALLGRRAASCRAPRPARSGRTRRRATTGRPPPAPSPAPGAAAASPPMSLVTQTLACLALFLLGYLAGRVSIVVGAAHA